MKITLTVAFVLMSLTNFAQGTNIFETKESVKSFLDGRTYIIPDYGTMRFEYNSNETKKWKERREKDQSDDEVLDVVFDLTIKRNAAKRKDKTDYQVTMKINLEDPQGQDYNPTESYANSFTVRRGEIYFIKDFPFMYILFADGDLYYQKVSYPKISFQEYKAARLKDNKAFSILATSDNANAIGRMVKCIQKN